MYYFIPIKLPKLNDSTNVDEAREQWELFYNFSGSENWQSHQRAIWQYSTGKKKKNRSSWSRRLVRKRGREGKLVGLQDGRAGLDHGLQFPRFHLQSLRPEKRVFAQGLWELLAEVVELKLDVQMGLGFSAAELYPNPVQSGVGHTGAQGQGLLSSSERTFSPPCSNSHSPCAGSLPWAVWGRGCAQVQWGLWARKPMDSLSAPSSQGRKSLSLPRACPDGVAAQSLDSYLDFTHVISFSQFKWS